MVKNRLIKDCVINNTPIGTRNPRTGRFTNCIFESYIKIGELTITNVDGSSGQVLSTDGNGTLSWANNAGGGGDTDLNDLTNVFIENNSIWLGNNPSGTTNNAEYNIAIGTTALDAITTGDNNIAIGHNALTLNTSGQENVAIGSNTMAANTSAEYCIAIGYNALKSVDSGNDGSAGDDNIAIGAGDCCGSITTGKQNIALGTTALTTNISGDDNVAIGRRSLRYCISNQNVALGNEAGDVITTGSNNIILGHGADPSANNSTNQIVIGQGATGHGDNIAVIGNTDCSAWEPADNNGVNLGSTNYKFKELYVNAINFGTDIVALPSTDGNPGQVLKTDGNGNLSWIDQPGSQYIIDWSNTKSNTTKYIIGVQFGVLFQRFIIGQSITSNGAGPSPANQSLILQLNPNPLPGDKYIFIGQAGLSDFVRIRAGTVTTQGDTNNPATGATAKFVGSVTGTNTDLSTDTYVQMNFVNSDFTTGDFVIVECTSTHSSPKEWTISGFNSVGGVTFSNYEYGE